MEPQNQDKVWVSVERTVNLGNYQNVKIAAGVSKTIQPSDDARMEAVALLDEFEALVEKRARKWEDRA